MKTRHTKKKAIKKEGRKVDTEEEEGDAEERM